VSRLLPSLRGKVERVKSLNPTQPIAFTDATSTAAATTFDVTDSLSSLLEYFSPKADHDRGLLPWLGTGPDGATAARLELTVPNDLLGLGADKNDARWYASSSNSTKRVIQCNIPLPSLTSDRAFWAGSHVSLASSLLEHNLPDKLPESSFVKMGEVGDVVVFDGSVVRRDGTGGWLSVVYSSLSAESREASVGLSIDDWIHDHSTASTTTTAPCLVDEVVKFEIRSNPVTGRCLFATTDIKYGELIHVAPALVVSKEEYDGHGMHTIMKEYCFNLPNGDKMMPLGYGGLFNHSSVKPNVDYRLDREGACVRFYSGGSITRGSELFIYYGDKLWFVDAEAEEAKRLKKENCAESSDDDDSDFMSRMNL
jgi:hypothetical protein